MTFEEDLTKRRIDVAAFAAGDPARFAEWQQMYAQMHPNSFYMAVKMVINDVRRRFWLAEAVKPAATQVTEAPAKPAVRRAAIPGAPKPAVTPTSEATPETETPPATTPAPAKARPVIKRPTVANAETPPPVVPETNNPAPIPTAAPEAGAEAPKAPRPRPVFRKPAIPESNPAETTPNKDKIAQEGTNAELPFHTNPDPEATAPKAPRPRPVIKRPTALQLPSEQSETNPPEPPVANEATTNNLTETAIPNPEPEPGAPKPPRPRPIFKRPAAPPVSPEEGNATAPPKDGVEEPLTAPVPEITAAEEKLAEPAAPKTPRPRPVMRRPTPPAEAPPITPAVTPEASVPPAPETPPASEPAEEPRKPPRPRPIFKRPTKPDEPGEAV